MSVNSELFERYHKGRNSGKSPKTIRLEGFVLKRLDTHVMKPMEQVTRQDLVDYFDYLAKQLSSYTIVTYKILLKKFFKWL